MTDSVTLDQSHNILASEADLRAVYKKPGSGAAGKTLKHIDVHFRRFIELSPFACLGTMGDSGLGDVTPRGGESGFVHVLDDTHLALPDRPGNNRLDSLMNIVQQPGVGLLFFIPGFEDTLRVNGVAHITTDPILMNRFTVADKAPLSVVVIEVREAYLHCAKAIRRAGLWSADVQVDRKSFPTAGQIYRDQLSLELPTSTIDAALEKDAQERLY